MSKLKEIRLMIFQSVMDMVVEHYKRKKAEREKLHEQTMQDSIKPVKQKDDVQ